MVDIVRVPRIQVAEGIVGNGCQMHDRVEAAEVGGCHVSNVQTKRRHVVCHATERAPLKEICIAADDVVTCLCEEANHD